ncbi:hypothetical protein [Croceitalea vernalis]|uniref:Lipoprotein n=1 Tax=Croceitalea vernalis TaxID=3075599 RepID=A0ABU3BIN9_9FLAO|nr:hypothetical protein [Croceitalea sp. P007]MDT0622028.1 hypothetical protein [Croceitalea sp. P007]
MNKPTIILFLTLILFSCKEKIERIDIANELRGNTFNMTSIGERDTLTIEFKDSTFTVFEYSDRNLPWRIASFENNTLLVFDSRVIAIEQIDKNTLKGLLISEKDYEVILEKRQVRWNKELLNGIWIEEKNYDLFFNDSIVKPPLPPAPPGVSESDFQYPPFYEIKGDTISASYFYQVSKSGIDINNTTEFLNLELPSDLDKVEKLWKIKKITDSIMIIDRVIEKEKEKFSFLTTTEENIKLIKKR